MQRLMVRAGTPIRRFGNGLTDNLSNLSNFSIFSNNMCLGLGLVNTLSNLSNNMGNTWVQRLMGRAGTPIRRSHRAQTPGRHFLLQRQQQQDPGYQRPVLPSANMSHPTTCPSVSPSNRSHPTSNNMSKWSHQPICLIQNILSMPHH